MVVVWCGFCGLVVVWFLWWVLWWFGFCGGLCGLVVVWWCGGFSGGFDFELVGLSLGLLNKIVQ